MKPYINSPHLLAWNFSVNHSSLDIAKVPCLQICISALDFPRTNLVDHAWTELEINRCTKNSQRVMYEIHISRHDFVVCPDDAILSVSNTCNVRVEVSNMKVPRIYLQCPTTQRKNLSCKNSWVEAEETVSRSFDRI